MNFGALYFDLLYDLLVEKKAEKKEWIENGLFEKYFEWSETSKHDTSLKRHVREKNSERKKQGNSVIKLFYEVAGI